MINWNKPIMLNGVTLHFREAGELNGSKLIIVGAPNSETLYFVNKESGHSSYLTGGELRPGPTFVNEVTSNTVVRYQNVYDNAEVVGGLNNSRLSSDTISGGVMEKRLGVTQIVTTVWSNGKVDVTATFAPTP